jgi:arabinogalactan endo-1,4-beta-galactosidase
MKFDPDQGEGLPLPGGGGWGEGKTFLLLIAFLILTVRSSFAEFIAGADFSHLQFFEDRGIVYKVNGHTQDGLTILKDHGVNCVRLRIFTSSAAQAQADAYNYTNNLAYVLPLAVRVKSAGLKLLLDFHYSDTWADPGHQRKPDAWTNLISSAQLQSQIRSYSSNTVAELKNAGALPDYVQPGNEITAGMVWESGRATGNTNAAWTNFCNLMKSAITGIKDAAPTNTPKIMVHIDRGGDWSTTKWYYDNLLNQQVAFDIIGQSYYPWWHGSPTNLQICLSNAAVRYGKPIMIAETAFPWGSSTNIYGIPATPNGQVQFVTQLASIIKTLPNSNGAGIIWWGTEYQQLPGTNLAGFDRRSFFGSDANALPVLDAFGSLTAAVAITPSLSNSTLTLQWPLSGTGLRLNTSTNLSSGSWTNVTNSVQTTGGVSTITLPQDATANRFYRLQSY